MNFRPTAPAAQLHSVCNSVAAAWRQRSSPASQAIIRSGSEVLVAAASNEAGSENRKLTRDLPLQRLESVLFLAREPLPSRKLAQLAQLDDGTAARTLVRRLNEAYDRQGRAFRVEEIAGGFQLLTRKKFASWIRRLGHITPEIRLSSPTLETLAVVAYRQPVLKADIEAIRGVNCGEILRQLMERDLVRIGGRSDDLGRPYLYATTKRFLQLFGLRSLEDLPQAEIIRFAPLPPVPKRSPSGQDTPIESAVARETGSETQRKTEEKESNVSVSISSELAYEEELARKFGSAKLSDVRLEDDEDEDLDDEEEDEDDDFEDEEEDEDWDDDEEDEEDDEEDDVEDEEWEEVADEELEEDEEEEDDLDDEEDDDEDWDDDEDDDEEEDWEEEAE